MTFFFIGIAGVGMSALAQFLALLGYKVLGSDRLFNQIPDHPIRKKLNQLNILTYPQGSAEIPDNSIVIVSSAIEETVPEYVQAKEKGLKIAHRSYLLASIARQYKTIAVAGTSGKSTTTALIFHILQKAGLKPSLINGAFMISLSSDDLLGNAWVDTGDWLVIEADESDGSLVNYKPQIGVLLNIGADHQEKDKLLDFFREFATNSQTVVFNREYFSFLNDGKNIDFCIDCQKARFTGHLVKTSWTGIEMKINSTDAHLPVLGGYNVQNAVAAIAAASAAGIELEQAINSLPAFCGLQRRMQVIYRGINFSIIDDYAHNPDKIRAAITTAQTLAPQVIAWFQPHGFSALKFYAQKLIETLRQILRQKDIFVMSDVYYSGGTVKREITSDQFIRQLRQAGVENAYYLTNRRTLPDFVKQKALPPTVILLMGARDPMLDFFANYVSNYVIYYDDLF